ncbi:MAG TPA: hypothetical protein VK599_03745 [Streptosporangiaceae bacterium]|nr:hypothetical protein [Streptosporangiaceae bacterium]
MRYVKSGMGLLAATAVMLAGAIAGFAAHVPTVGITFLAFMIASAAPAFGVAFTFWLKARKWRDQQPLAARAAAAGLPPGSGQRR